MPRFPELGTVTEPIRGSVFTALAARLESYPGELYPFHVGDTWKAPPPGAGLREIDERHREGGLNRYTAPSGRASLRSAVVERLRARTGLPLETSQVLVTGGATGALAAAVPALAGPGDEVLLLAPYWPLIEGIVHTARATPRAVPIHDLETPDELVRRLDSEGSERTVAVYVNSPNNPTSRVLPPDWLEAIAAWAQRNDCWVIADEVYEQVVFAGEQRLLMQLDFDRTLSVFSFSKAYGVAGYRCGYLAAPAELVAAAAKMATHTLYSVPTASQAAAEALLNGGADRWLRETRDQYREIGAECADALGLPRPEGGTFLFFDVGPLLDERGLGGLLEDCADRGVFLAPGSSFGPYDTWVRLCYTATAPDVTRRGVEALRQVLAERKGERTP